MTAVPYRGEDEAWDEYEDPSQAPLPGRPRRHFWGRGSAVLLAVVLGAVGFYAGVRVEKGQLSNSSSALPSGSSGTAASLRARFASAFGGRSGAAGASGGAAASRAGAAGATGGFPAGGFAGAAGNSSFGTVSSVDGKSIYITETASGNVVKVTLSSATKVTKNVGVSKASIHPGDTVVVQGVKNSKGTISATSVSDTGARSTGTGSSSGSSGSSSSTSSAVSSLFGGG